MVNKDNEQECIANATLVSVFAQRFPAGRWSFLGLGSETKWYSQILYCVSWKGEREPSIKHCMGRDIDVVQKFTRMQSFGQN